MVDVIIYRARTSSQGTFGYYLHPDMVPLKTCELPWQNNQHNVSCILAGVYDVVPHVSHKFGNVWHVLKVKDRSWILTHSGNVAGLVSEGWYTHSEGCILLGKYFGYLTYNGRKQQAVLASKSAIRSLHELGLRKYKLEIKNGF